MGGLQEQSDIDSPKAINPFWALAAGIVCLIVAIAFAHALHSYRDAGGASEIISVGAVASEFIKEFGFALVIAYVISATIEKKARWEYNNLVNEKSTKMNRNVFEAIYNTRIPNRVFSEVESAIIKVPFLRENFRVRYEFTRIHEENALRCNASISYNIINLSGDRQTFDLKINLEKPFHNKFLDLVKVTSVCVGPHTFTDQDIATAYDAAQDTESFVKYKHRVKMDPNQRIHVNAKYVMIKALSDTEVWRCIVPTDGIDLAVVMPKDLAHVYATAAHRNELAQTHGGEGNQMHEWELRDVVLPHQGFVLWWQWDVA